MGRLAGKTAFITGAGTGIGRQAASLFAAEGANVVVAEINAQTGQETADKVNSEGGKATFIETDVTSPEILKSSIDQTVDTYGRLDILYNNAGGANSRDDTNILDVPIEEFWRALRLDLFGTFLGCRFAIPYMMQSGGGSIVNVVSIVALRGFKTSPSYTSAKGGIAALTRALAVTYAPNKIRVNAIAPCITRTARVLRHLETVPVVTAMAEDHLLGLADPIDIAQGALYLASDESRVVTGQILAVDSGVSIS